VAEHEDVLRRLAIRDDAYVDSLLSDDRENMAASRLDPKTHALVRVAALIGIDAAPPSYMSAVELGLRHGATIDEIVGTLIAVIPVIGSGRVVSAAPKLGLAVGYDVGQALEELDPDRVARARKRTNGGSRR
jgi:alkylhydroperoxidase/carboxymuconolactone decarboxylase family protein YurZ